MCFPPLNSPLYNHILYLHFSILQFKLNCKHNTVPISTAMQRENNAHHICSPCKKVLWLGLYKDTSVKLIHYLVGGASNDTALTCCKRKLLVVNMLCCVVRCQNQKDLKFHTIPSNHTPFHANG